MTINIYIKKKKKQKINTKKKKKTKENKLKYERILLQKIAEFAPSNK
jgi:hypothetical protein